MKSDNIPQFFVPNFPDTLQKFFSGLCFVAVQNSYMRFKISVVKKNKKKQKQSLVESR